MKVERSQAPMSATDIAVAKRMKSRGMSDALISNRLGFSRDAIRRAIDPNYRERRNEQARRARDDRGARNLGGYIDRVRSGPEIVRRPKYDPHVDGPPVYAGAFDELLGDPPVGRRAIDLR